MQTKTIGAVAIGALLTSVAAYAIGADGTATSTPEITVVSVPGATAGDWASTSEAAAAATPETNVAAWAEAGFVFGVQTHFSQGWNAAWLDLTSQIATKTIRDTVNWASVERSSGVYNFDRREVQTLASFCARGGKLSLTIVPKNALYDGGATVSSTAGNAAFAAYVSALLTRFGPCVSAIEVGNEINGAGTLDYPTGVDKFATYVDTLKVLYAKVKPANPQVVILGGSTNTIGTGFLESLFEDGMLDVVDGIAVHPYRPEAESLDLEIANLNAVMAKYGKPKPIWATEFSYGFEDSRRASASLVKSVVELYAAGVTHANWYALVEQRTFPNMGLFNGLATKPQGRAYRTVIDSLLPYGKPVRVDTGDKPIYLYRIGADRWVVWGVDGTIRFNGGTARDMFGTALPSGPIAIGSEPVIIEGGSGYSIDQSPVIADTLLQYGTGAWSYLRRDKAGKDTALGMVDNDFTSYFGDRWSKPLRINNMGAAPAGDGAAPARAVIRYTAPRAMQVDIAACFGKTNAGDGVDYRVERNGAKIASGVLVGAVVLNGLKIDLAAGDKVDFSFGPNQTYGNDSFRYRATLSARGQGKPVVCPTS